MTMDPFEEFKQPKAASGDAFAEFKTPAWKLPRGATASRPLNEAHPDLPPGIRFKLSNFSGGDPVVAKRNLEELGFEVHDRGNWRFSLRKRGKNEPWRQLEPEGFDIQDPLDVLGGVATTAGQVIGGIGGAALGTPEAPGVGTVIGGAAGAAAGGAAVEAGLGGIGQMLGIKRAPGEFGRAVGTEAAIGAGGEVLGAAARPVLKGAVKLGKGAWNTGKRFTKHLEDITGATRRDTMQKLGDEIALRQAAIGQATDAAGQAIPGAKVKVGAAKGVRSQATADFKAAEAEATDRLQREANNREFNAIYDAKEALANAEAGRVIDETGARAFKTVPAEEPVHGLKPKKGPPRVAEGGEGLRAPETPILGPGAVPRAFLDVPDPMRAAQQEMADEATGYRTYLEGLVGGAGRNQRFTRQLEGGWNPATFAKVSWLQANPKLVEGLVSSWGRDILPRVGSWSIRNRLSWLSHLAEDRPEVFKAGWKKWTNWLQREVDEAIDETFLGTGKATGTAAGKVAGATDDIAAQTAKSQAADLKAASRKMFLGEEVDPGIGKRLEELVSARMESQALKLSPVAQAKEALKNAQGLVSVAEAELAKAQHPLLKTQEALQPIRSEVRSLRSELAKERANRPPVPVPEWMHSVIGARRIPFQIGKQLLKDVADRPRVKLFTEKAKGVAQKLASKPRVRIAQRAAGNALARASSGK